MEFEFIEGDWELPTIKYQPHPLKTHYNNIANILCLDKRNFDMFGLAEGISHEINHWAQFAMIPLEIRPKINSDYSMMQFWIDHDKMIIEKMADWGIIERPNRKL
jgi:hypothetical protein